MSTRIAKPSTKGSGNESFQLSALQWILVLVGFGMSGGVLALSLWPDLTKKSPKFGTILLIIVVALHLLLACGFMLAFFHAPATPVQEVQPATKNVTAEDPKEQNKPDISKEKREEKVESNIKKTNAMEDSSNDVRIEPEKSNKSKAAATLTTEATQKVAEKESNSETVNKENV